MAEENAKKGLNTLFKIILGLALLIAGIITIIIFWNFVLELIKAGVGFVLILAGAIVLAIAKD
ncbi:MAG: hypothetical protein AB1629_06610 [Candidatus Omnitrophota bacterium]